VKELTLLTVKRSSLLLYWQKRKEITYLDSLALSREHSIHESLPRERDKLTQRNPAKGWSFFVFPNYGFSCSGIYASISVNFWFNPSGPSQRQRPFFSVIRSCLKKRQVKIDFYPVSIGYEGNQSIRTDRILGNGDRLRETISVHSRARHYWALQLSAS